MNKTFCLSIISTPHLHHQQNIFSAIPNKPRLALHTFSLPIKSFESLGWGGKECHWELVKFRDNWGHECS
ncbi:hypothetical protein VP01_1472g4 [Puccinia sorghi]|uniref:Uncharacterized protein n=1 Tax=Puccinia sorghi TaxID=27349 RepID=A0A0L6VLI8_9BASI|nr:hypothetical protein VP01_1472g4 [Puccinia sorghi]